MIAPITTPAIRNAARIAMLALASILLLAAAARPAAAAEVHVWHVPWDKPGGDRTLAQNSEIIDGVSTFSYTLTPSGKIRPTAGAYPVRDGSQARRLGMQVIPTIANEFDPDRVAKVLKTRASRRKHANKIARLVNRKRFDGIDIDYENLRMKDSKRFVLFLNALRKRLDRTDKILSVAIQVRTGSLASSGAMATSYRGIGRAAHQVRLMAYDYHWAGGPAGPVAPRRWVREVVDYAKVRIPKRKLYLGVPLYGYHWVKGGSGSAVTWKQANKLRRKQGVRARWSNSAGSHWFEFRKNGRRHVVWYETPRSLKIKGAIARKTGIAGVATWAIGSQHPDAFRKLAKGLGE